ncbi:MAG: histidine phosphatase family protein [Oscillospiraceae bacterium]|nr:histidine phosphatase family protein [Oscillospiraceae bacterium]
MLTYKLHLIRHGLTSGNTESRYVGGGTDESLCQLGIDSLNFLKDNYSYPKVEKVYTSPMKRAVETCEIIYPDCDYTAVDNLKECNFGEFENKSFAELSNNIRFSYWLKHQSEFVPEGGESNQEFAQRCADGLNQVFMDMMKNNIHEAACICHGGVMALLLGMYAYPQKPFHEWTSDSGCGFTVATNTQLWTRDNVMEAVDILPLGWGEVIKQANEANTNK